MSKKENKLNENNKKVPFNVLKKGAIFSLLGLTIGVGCLGLAGCSFNGKDGQNGKAGTQWYSGDTDIEYITYGVNGDYYYDTNDYKLYQKENGSWVLKVDNFGKSGRDGTSTYIGYDGYVWQDGQRTNFKLDQDTTGRENVVEDTIGVYTTMGYWKGEYVDLSTNSIALMANYKPNAKLTQYSGTKVTEIQVVAENAGTLRIGTAKVANVVNARTTGATYTATTTSYKVDAGLNTISIDLTVAEDETVVLGGANSTAKIYVVKNLPVDDEQGNYTLVDASIHNDIISKTGNYADTLAVSVRAESTIGVTQKIFPNITTQVSDSSISGMYAVNTTSGPYRYINTDLFSGKTITKFGLPVKTIRDEDTITPYVTIYVVKNSVTSNYISNKVASYKIEFPDAKANKWAYAECEIPLADDETIAISASESDSSIQWGCSLSTLDDSYKFYNNASGTGGAAV